MQNSFGFIAKEHSLDILYMYMYPDIFQNIRKFFSQYEPVAKTFRICKNFPVSIADALTGFFWLWTQVKQSCASLCITEMSWGMVIKSNCTDSKLLQRSPLSNQNGHNPLLMHRSHNHHLFTFEYLKLPKHKHTKKFILYTNLILPRYLCALQRGGWQTHI